MTALVANEVLGVANPKLTALVAASDGFLTDPYALEYAIIDRTGSAPSTEVARTAVDLVADRLGVGRFALDWTVPAAAAVGRWQIQWWVQLSSGGAWGTWRDDFEVLDQVEWTGRPYESAYALVADLRDEGLSTSYISDARAQQVLARAAALIEQATGRIFYPLYRAASHDGRRQSALFFDDAIVALESVTVLGSLTAPDPIGPDALKVYNRHLSQGVLVPDDRDHPKVEFAAYDAPESTLRSLIYRSRFPEGAQNVHVRGVFGYREPNGSPRGGVPILVRQCALLLAYRDMFSLVDSDKREDVRRRWQIQSERTRDQSYTLATDSRNAAMVGTITGDPEVDLILSRYRRPPRIGTA